MQRVFQLIAPAGLMLVLFWSMLAYAVDFGQVVEENEYTDVVAIGRYDEGLQDAQLFCSGVVVAPRVILTAAHCLQEGGHRLGNRDFQQIVRSLRVYFGNGTDGGIVSDNLYPIQRAIIHRNYLRDIRGQADIAILLLEQDAPIAKEQIRPIALDIGLLRNEIRRGATLEVVGFGHSEQLQGRLMTTEYFGIKHKGPIRIEGKTADEVLVTPGPAIDRFGLYNPGPREGDSGGPAFFHAQDGLTYLVGVVSRATKFNHGPRGMAFSLARQWICWIERESGVNLRGHLPSDTPDFCSMPVARTLVQDPVADFLTLCQDSTVASNSQAYTIYILKRLTGVHDCRELKRELQTRTNLSLDATYINDLSPLAFFTQLERLIIRDNAITSVAPLRQHTRLRTLDISYNVVRDSELMAPLEEAGLWLVGARRQYNEITRTNFVRLCSDQQTISAARDTINAMLEIFGFEPHECVNGNYELIRLREIEFYNRTGLTNMDALRGLTTLERLDLSGQAVQDLSFIDEIDDLRVLVLDGNPLTDLTPLLKHRNLRELSVRNLNLTDLSIIAQLPRLQILHVAGNKIDDFTALEERERRGTLRVHGKEEQNLQGQQ
jgi:hypothetical protein